MSKVRNQDFIRGSDRQQAWQLRITAVSVIAMVGVSFAGYELMYPVFQSKDTIDLAIDVPAVAPGVHTGTKVILRGAEVGEVSELTRSGDNTVRMNLSLQPSDVGGLTDAVDVDFRPENYFGVTAVNLGGKNGGAPLASGQVIDRTSAGDFTMSTMIAKGSIVVDGTLTKSMIDSLDKVIRYTDGLTPMIQAGIVFANRVAQTQQALPSTLLSNMNNTLDVLPGFSQEAIDALYAMYDNNANRNPDGSFGHSDAYWAELDEGIELVLGKLFLTTGNLLQSHNTELTPMTQLVAALTGVVPNLLDGGNAAAKISALVNRYNKAFTGPDNAKTLNLRLVLDNLPAIATPLELTGLPQQPHEETP
ncbi:MlaD family protein [Nocardia sp. NPDC052278]|uniref:MlaD family protein n=1 Tax=unclassified Nocardia TaxID=2637762 RepID=UPI00367C745E